MCGAERRRGRVRERKGDGKKDGEGRGGRKEGKERGEGKGISLINKGGKEISNGPVPSKKTITDGSNEKEVVREDAVVLDGSDENGVHQDGAEKRENEHGLATCSTRRVSLGLKAVNEARIGRYLEGSRRAARTFAIRVSSPKSARQAREDAHRKRENERL